MKRIIILAFICLFVLTGCGKNRLVCTLKSSDDEQSSEEKYIMHFDGDNFVETVTWTYSVNLKGNYNTQANINDTKEAAETEALYYNQLPGMKARVDVKKSKVTMKVEMEVAKMEYTDVRSLNLDFAKEDLKDSFAQGGYTCK